MNTENLIKSSPFQMFVNLQYMDKKERKAIVKWVVSLSTTNCSFLQYSFKYAYVKLLSETECYFNGKGYTTQVIEFKKAGFYIGDTLEIDFNKVYSK